MLGYPDQGLKRTQESLALARELAHPMSLAIALSFALNSHQFRREPQVVREHAEAVIALCSEQGFPFHLAWATIVRGWALAVQGHQEEGVGQMRHGLAAQRATGADLTREYFLGLLAAVYWEIGQPTEGLLVLAEALAVLSENRQSMWEAELYRLKGELSLQSGARGLESQLTNPQSLAPRPHVETEAEACFLKAIDVARQQQAKSLELRATVSLARLWQQQGKQQEAHRMLSDIYNWFTEGFETKDLQEAKALLNELH
jgi:predicted ATPase